MGDFKTPLYTTEDFSNLINTGFCGDMEQSDVSLDHSEEEDPVQRNRSDASSLITDDADKQFWADNELDSDIGSVKGQAISEYISRKSENRARRKPTNRQRLHRFCNWEPPMAITNDGAMAMLNNNGIESISSKISNFKINQNPKRSSNQIQKRTPKRRLRSSRGSESVNLKPQDTSSSESDSCSFRRKNTVSESPSSDDQVSALPGEQCPKCKLHSKNAIIVHGRIGHQCYCYRCTMKLMRANGNCGMCHRKIRRVVKNVSIKPQNKDNGAGTSRQQ